MENESLPLYEGVDWNMFITSFCLNYSLPLYEGVDWNWSVRRGKRTGRPVSLFTREWIEIIKSSACDSSTFVSLFTREWIEIDGAFCRCFAASGLPLYEGVDWNPTYQWMTEKPVLSPSLRGSGLKSFVEQTQTNANSLPLYEGVDWNCWVLSGKRARAASPSLRGSGLKFVAMFRVFRVFVVSPSLRGSGLKYHRKLVSR